MRATSAAIAEVAPKIATCSLGSLTPYYAAEAANMAARDVGREEEGGRTIARTVDGVAPAATSVPPTGWRRFARRLRIDGSAPARRPIRREHRRSGMAKHKRSRQHKADANATNGSARTPWSDLEQSFFASAPPDEPQAPGEAERFDDLEPAMPAQRPGRTGCSRRSRPPDWTTGSSRSRSRASCC